MGVHEFAAGFREVKRTLRNRCYRGVVARDSTHADYAAKALEWSRARDVLSGEDAVKAAGKKYLPRLDSQSDDEYAAYLARASFFGATARTLEEYLDLVFRRAPAFALRATAGRPADGLERFAGDCDLWGADFLRYARRVVSEVLSVGRAGSLVAWDDVVKRPWVSEWRAEDIINWSVERVGQVPTLVEVVLRDPPSSGHFGGTSAGRVRVLRLDGKDGKNGTYECLMEIWEAAKDQSDEKDQKDWTLVETQVLMRDGQALTFIPFVFHGLRHSRPELDKLPLGEIIAANLDHYRLVGVKPIQSAFSEMQNELCAGLTPAMGKIVKCWGEVFYFFCFFIKSGLCLSAFLLGCFG